MEVKKVIKMGVTMEYLGSRILDISMIEISMIESFETNPDFSRQYYDKIANFQKIWYYFENQELADRAYFPMIRKLKKMRGIKNFPDNYREQYLKIYSRAAELYPEAII